MSEDFHEILEKDLSDVFDKLQKEDESNETNETQAEHESESDQENGDIPEAESGDGSSEPGEQDGGGDTDTGGSEGGDESEVSEETKAESSEEESSGESTEGGGSEEQSQYVNPPDTWTAEAKSNWKDVPERIRQEVSKREKDLTAAYETNRDKIDYAQRVEKIVSPYSALIKSQGLTEEQAIGTMLDTYYKLNTGSPQEKAGLLLQTAQAMGADMSIFSRPVQQNTEVAQLRNELNQFRQNQAQRDQTALDATDQNLSSVVDSFSKEMNEKGELTYPYFSNVQDLMPALITKLKKKTPGLSETQLMEKAYNQACWSDPDIRNVLQGETLKAKEAKDQEKARKHAEKAKKAAKLNTDNSSSHASSKSKPANQSIEKDMDHTYDEIMAR